MNPLVGNTVESPEATPFLSNLLGDLSVWIGGLLSEIKTTDSLAPLLVLLAVSFVYGFVHASGPGHGKTLVASYFAANDKSYKKGIAIAMLIATVHTFSALLAAIVGYYLFRAVFAMTVSNAAVYATKASGIMIAALGIYFLYDKIKHYKNLSKTKWSIAPPSSCSCSGCKTKDSSELVVVLSAGMVPCPGTVTVFLFSISLGLYFVGFLSALCMSLGMGVVMAVTALASTKIRNSGKERFSKVIPYLDFGAVFVIIALGIILSVA